MNHVASGMLLAALATPVLAHDLAVSVTTEPLESPTLETLRAGVALELSWRNAWRAGDAHDGVWLFVDYRANEGPWRRMTCRAAPTLSGDSSSLLEATRTRDGRGLFLHHSSDGRGDQSCALVVPWEQPEWDGMTLPAKRVEFRAFGVEMVRVPAGPYSLGDPGGEQEVQAAFGLRRVETEAELLVGLGLAYEATTPRHGDGLGALGPAFPKGHAAFWVMKYELTQGDYAGFLNQLGSEARARRTLRRESDYGARRGTLRLERGHYVAGRPARACNRLSWEDGLAWADWAGLRPLTELEFEKAARGSDEAVHAEFPWATRGIDRTTRIEAADGSLAEGEDGTERCNGNANFDYGGPEVLAGGDRGRGPLRVGIYEAAHPTDRVRSGGSSLGVMELAGNLWERCVSVGAPAGRAFAASHGDGRVSWFRGAHTNVDWPTTRTGGYGSRGGSWHDQARALRVADRRNAAWADGGRGRAHGFRAARTAEAARRFLFVGNSHTFTEDLPGTFGWLSERSGDPRPAVVTTSALRGDSFHELLARHDAGEDSWLDAIATERFEVVVLQENGGILGRGVGDLEHARRLVSAVRAADATPVLLMTWGYLDRPAVTTHGAADAVERWGAELDALIAPCGLAWEALERRHPELSPWSEDGEHPSYAGTYLNACVLFALLYGRSPVDVGSVGLTRVTREAGRRIEEVAAEVVTTYVQPRAR